MLRKIFAIETSPASHRERLLSGLGGCLAILAVFLASQVVVGEVAAAMLVASMGASAVLLFAVPHGSMSQPWPVLGGHVASALIGVACATWLGRGAGAAALAVGLAITAMYYLRCLHPPGGATALVAVTGGPAVAALGFEFVLTPVLLNVAIILATAVAFNAVFRWRRYPAALAPAPAAGPVGPAPIAHEDFVYALSELDSFVDVSEDDLLEIYRLATGHQAARGGRTPRPGSTAE